jgi:protoheme IX farnesyltransferase
MAHFLHRIIAVIVGVFVFATAIYVWRAVRNGRRDGRAVPGGEAILALVATGAALYAVQVVVGALQLTTNLAAWAVALHLALGALIWALAVSATFVSYFEARTFGSGVPADEPSSDERDTESGGASSASLRDRVSAYVALTKPRIIELLLVTTVPAMFLAARGVPPLDLVFWTLVGGTLAAGAANAINCYLDRDIDLIMTRTRRRPLPAHQVNPEDALVFGLILGVIAFAVMAIFTNLVAAFLTLLAMAFYVVIYTMLLKRSTPQNIVLGGAAGALPPVIGWAAVTGDIALPALVLFAIVFYWTPPHFWALSMRLRRDYAAANVPMMPVTHGVQETTRQIALYSVLMVCLTLIFFAVARMGLVFLAGALILGALFLVQAFEMWRDGTDARAVRLYKFSITYLTALFALMILDVFIFVPL